MSNTVRASEGTTLRSDRKQSLADSEDRNVFLEQLIREVGKGYALFGSEHGKIGLNVAVEVDRHVEPRIGAMEFAAHCTGKINLGRNVVVLWGNAWHVLTY